MPIWDLATVELTTEGGGARGPAAWETAELGTEVEEIVLQQVAEDQEMTGVLIPTRWQGETEEDKTTAEVTIAMDTGTTATDMVTTAMDTDTTAMDMDTAPMDTAMATTDMVAMGAETVATVVETAAIVVEMAAMVVDTTTEQTHGKTVAVATRTGQRFKFWRQSVENH